MTALSRMPKSLDHTIQLPELDIVTVHKLFGLIDSLGFVLTMQVNAFLNVPVRSQEISAVALHALELKKPLAQVL